MRLQAQAEQPLLQRLVRGELRHRAGMDDAAVVHHADMVADACGDAEILLDQKDGRAARLISVRHSISAPTIAGARPLVGSSISSSLRGSTIARAIDSICFWPPDSVPARDSQNLLQRREEAENPVEPRVVERAVARRQHQIFRTVRSENTAMVSGT